MTECPNVQLQLGICKVLLLFSLFHPMILNCLSYQVWFFNFCLVFLWRGGGIPDDVEYIITDWICQTWFSPNIVLSFVVRIKDIFLCCIWVIFVLFTKFPNVFMQQVLRCHKWFGITIKAKQMETWLFILLSINVTFE